MEPRTDSRGRSCMFLRFPVGPADGRQEPCNYYQGEPLYFTRDAFDNVAYWTQESWWASAKKWIRSEPKAQIFV